MSTVNTYMSNNERYVSKRVSRRLEAYPDHAWRKETPQRSASRSKPRVTKKIMKIEKSKMKAKRGPTKNQVIRRTPGSPHNTTHCIEMPNLYLDHDRFAFDFEFHASAGSMMSLMSQKFTQTYEKCTDEPKKVEDAFEACEESSQIGQEEEKPVKEESQSSYGHNIEHMGSWEVNAREELVNSEISGLNTNSCFTLGPRDQEGNNPYSHLLEQAEAGKDFQGLVRRLVSTLREKEQQINTLKSLLQTESPSNTQDV